MLHIIASSSKTALCDWHTVKARLKKRVACYTVRAKLLRVIATYCARTRKIFRYASASCSSNCICKLFEHLLAAGASDESNVPPPRERLLCRRDHGSVHCVATEPSFAGGRMQNRRYRRRGRRISLIFFSAHKGPDTRAHFMRFNGTGTHLMPLAACIVHPSLQSPKGRKEIVLRTAARPKQRRGK